MPLSKSKPVSACGPVIGATATIRNGASLCFRHPVANDIAKSNAVTTIVSIIRFFLFMDISPDIKIALPNGRAGSSRTDVTPLTNAA
jgi:hypothetical protein